MDYIALNPQKKTQTETPFSRSVRQDVLLCTILRHNLEHSISIELTALLVYIPVILIFISMPAFI